MKKKALLLASMGVLACTVGVTALAVGGANQLDISPAKANPTEYNVTFGWEEPTTVKDVNGNYAFSTTTAGGNKVGVVGHNMGEGNERFYFHKRLFTELYLYEFQSALANADAFEFSHITGFAISFTGESEVVFNGGFDEDEVFIPVESGVKYDVSLTSSDLAGFMTNGEDIVQVTSLTIWYSC